jgi:hypothetical protein
MLQTNEVDEEMGTKLIYVGLDGEMTGTELSAQARLCQIGIAFDTKRTFVSDIGWGVGDYIAVDQALEVNKFTHRRIQQGPDPTFVDNLLESFLVGNGGLKDKKIFIPVGFNVGRFDMPFVEDALPISNQYFSRRTIDLNAICFDYDGEIKYEGSYPTWRGWKRLAKNYAQEIIDTSNVQGAAHDAGWDAVQAILCLEFLKSVIRT